IIAVAPALYTLLESPYRYALLRGRLRGFTRTLLQRKNIDTRSAARAWTAARRLREVLPVLQLPGSSIEKVTAKLRRLLRRLDEVRESGAVLELLDQVVEGARRGRSIAARVRVNLDDRGKRARADFFRKKVGHDTRRVLARLTDQLELLGADGDGREEIRDLQWAVRARVSRRAADLKM